MFCVQSIESSAAGGGNKKRMSVERIYQKKTQLEHILLRPDTYIGSVERTDRAVGVCAHGRRMLLVRAADVGVRRRRETNCVA